jgi:nitroreductase
LIQECYQAKWFVEAPVYIIACADVSQSWKRSFDGKEHADIDVAIAVEHICLAAAEQGLGTCWVCNFDAKKCSEVLNLPANIFPVAIIPIGYTTQEVSRNPVRKSADEIIKIIE